MKGLKNLKKLLGIAETVAEPTMHPEEPGYESRDQRYRSIAKIVPPFPLPHVSRASLRRVKDPLPIPTVCPFCNGRVVLDSNDAIYRGRRYGDWPYVYMCAQDCDAYVGLHPHTDLPLGYLADRATRDARKEAKELFFIWKDAMGYGRDQRTQAYQKLSQMTDIPVAECHFAMFDVHRCNLAISYMSEALAEKFSAENPNDDIPF